MKVFLCMFMTIVIKCHSLSFVIFNEKMTLFEMSLLWAWVRGSVRSNNVIFALKMTTEQITLIDSCPKHAYNLLHIHYMYHVMIMKVSCQSYAHTPSSKVLLKSILVDMADSYMDTYIVLT